MKVLTRCRKRVHRRGGFAHPSFVDMLALAFIAVMILFMLFINRKQWEQRVFLSEFLRIDAQVLDNKKPADGTVQLILIPPAPKDGESQIVWVGSGEDYFPMGSNWDYRNGEQPTYFYQGFSLEDEATARLEVSEGLINKSGKWLLLAQFIPEHSQTPGSQLAWNMSVVHTDPISRGGGVISHPFTPQIGSVSADQIPLPADLRALLESKSPVWPGNPVDSASPVGRTIYYEFTL